MLPMTVVVRAPLNPPMGECDGVMMVWGVGSPGYNGHRRPNVTVCDDVNELARVKVMCMSWCM